MASSSEGNVEQQTIRHYTRDSLLQTILDGLRAAGADPERLTTDDLAAVDEFHVGGRAATAEFAEEMDVEPGMRLLDVGCGIGGPSRYFAAERGCLVTGIDLTAEYCETAKALSVRTGLGDRTEYRQASATALPFGEASFDGAYMLHVGMNIQAKGQAFGEVARVLRPGGVFGIFDVMREAGGEFDFPLPWTTGPETSFVETADTYVELLLAAGFEILRRRSRREFALAFFAKMREAAASGSPPRLGLPVLMGPAAPVKMGNLTGLLERGVLSPTEIIGRKI